jgi:hypothetical protein
MITIMICWRSVFRFGRAMQLLRRGGRRPCEVLINAGVQVLASAPWRSSRMPWGAGSGRRQSAFNQSLGLTVAV